MRILSLLMLIVVFVFGQSYAADKEKNASYLLSIDSLELMLTERSGAEEGHIICQIGSLWYRNFNFDKGLECASEALRIGQLFNDSSLIIRALRLFADNYYSMGQYDQSINYFKQELEFHLKATNQHKIAEVYCNIGVNYEVRGNVQKGLEYYLKALKLYEEVDDKEGLWATHSNMAFVYRSLGNDKEAIVQFEKAAEIEKTYLDVDKEHYFLVNIAESLNNLGDKDKALGYLFKADSMLVSIDKPDDEDYLVWIDCYRILGDIFASKGRAAEAESRYLKALRLSKIAKYIEREGKVVAALGAILVDKGEFDRAGGYLNRGIEIANETQNYYLKRDAYKALANMSARQGKFEQAWEYQILHGIASDSVLDIESNKQINILQIEYETEKREGQIQLLTKEKEIQNLQLHRNKAQKRNLAFMAFLLLFVSFIVFNGYRLKKKSAAMLFEKNNQLSLLNATKDKLFSIVSHDMKNSMAGFCSLIETLNKQLDNITPEQLKYFIGELSLSSSALREMMKNLLEWAKTQQNAIRFENNIINIHDLFIEVIDQNKQNAGQRNIAFDLNISNSGFQITSDKNVISTILRNLLSNAIKYSPNNSTITIDVSKKGKELHFSVSDVGAGMEQEQIDLLLNSDLLPRSKPGVSGDKGSGIGLRLSIDLLRKISADIAIGSTKNKGTKFEITIPDLTT
jgi:signal transduction histidine kinase